MNWFKSLFSESSDVSMTRFLSFLAVVTACLIAFKVVVGGGDLSAASVLCGTFLAAAFTGKVAQSFAERDEPK
jgi:predicted ABC-type sugar transport system permease subunit